MNGCAFQYEFPRRRVCACNSLSSLDRFGRVADQVWEDYGATPDVLDRYTYTYDRVGNRTSRDNELHAAFDEDYIYDGLYRLTDADRADAFDQSWTLDGLGNWGSFDDDGTSQDRTVNEANEIQSISGNWITPEYDAAGNMISGPKPGDETTRVHYIYDAWNRLVEVRADNSGTPGDLIAGYSYDGLNRRIEKEVVAGSVDTHYYYNHEWQMLEERQVDGTGATTEANQYVWSARYIDSPILRFHDDNGDGDLLDAGDTTRYYTTDANHNVTAVIDASTGNVVTRYAYTPYGQAAAYDPNWSNPAAPTEDGPLYCGYFFDAESDLYQVRNRYYDSSLGRFVSTDPIGYEGGDNSLYRYVHNGPLNRTDPQGLKEIIITPIAPPAVSPEPPPSMWGKLGPCCRIVGARACLFLDFVFGSGSSTCGDAQWYPDEGTDPDGPIYIPPANDPEDKKEEGRCTCVYDRGNGQQCEPMQGRYTLPGCRAACKRWYSGHLKKVIWDGQWYDA